MTAIGPGFVIQGKYRLVKKLGEGGMGSVWRADHLTLNAPVAVKLLDPSIANTEEGLARFMREAQAAAALRGAHVVQTFDYGVDDDLPFIVMEQLVGESLADRLEQKGPLSPKAFALLIKQVARALSKAHEGGIVHRDLKPDNIFLVDADGDDFTAKVLDFGIAKASGGIAGAGTDSKTRTGALLGTPYYMSPEQARGSKDIDHRSDIWSLGVIGFECLLGRRPFDGDALGDLLMKICSDSLPVPSAFGRVPSGFDQWFLRSVSRDPSQRFSSTTDMAKEFEGLLVAQTVDPFEKTGAVFAPVSGVTIQPAGGSLAGSTTSPRAEARPNQRLIPMVAGGLGIAVLVGSVVVFSHRSPVPAIGAPVSASAATQVATSNDVAPMVPAPVPVKPPRVPTEVEPVVVRDQPASPPSSATPRSSTAPVPFTRVAARPASVVPKKAMPAAAPAPVPAPQDDNPLTLRH